MSTTCSTSKWHTKQDADCSFWFKPKGRGWGGVIFKFTGSAFIRRNKSGAGKPTRRVLPSSGQWRNYVDVFFPKNSISCVAGHWDSFNFDWIEISIVILRLGVGKLTRRGLPSSGQWRNYTLWTRFSKKFNFVRLKFVELWLNWNEHSHLVQKYCFKKMATGLSWNARDFFEWNGHVGAASSQLIRCVSGDETWFISEQVDSSVNLRRNKAVHLGVID